MARILVIDDEQAIVMLLKRILAGAGHEVLVATDGGKGLQMAEQEQVDLILSDLSMPGVLSGLQLLAAIRKALAGGRYVTPLLAEVLAATISGATPAVPHELLSNRELQVLRLVALGKPLKEIAGELSLSEKTIGTYRMRISQKIGLSTNVELARYAVHHKLVD